MIQTYENDLYPVIATDSKIMLLRNSFEELQLIQEIHMEELVGERDELLHCRE